MVLEEKFTGDVTDTKPLDENKLYQGVIVFNMYANRIARYLFGDALPMIEYYSTENKGDFDSIIRRGYVIRKDTGKNPVLAHRWLDTQLDFNRIREIGRDMLPN